MEQHNAFSTLGKLFIKSNTLNKSTALKPHVNVCSFLGIFFLFNDYLYQLVCTYSTSMHFMEIKLFAMPILSIYAKQNIWRRARGNLSLRGKIIQVNKILKNVY